MDPISSLSVASAIIQFVDFGSKLVGRGRRIYKNGDGTLAEYVDKEVAVSHLNYLNENLQDSIGGISTWRIAKRDRALYDLCSKCRNAGDELLDHLVALKVDGSHRKWKSFRQALKSVWLEDALNDMEKRLAIFREEIEFHILVDLRENVDLLSIQQSQQFKRLDQATKQMTNAIIKNHHLFADDLSAHTMAISRLHKQTEQVVKVGFEKAKRSLRRLE